MICKMCQFYSKDIEQSKSDEFWTKSFASKVTTRFLYFSLVKYLIPDLTLIDLRKWLFFNPGNGLKIDFLYMTLPPTFYLKQHNQFQVPEFCQEGY